MLNLARKLKNFIFADDSNEFDTQEDIKNETKIFTEYQNKKEQSSADGETMIRQSLQQKKVSLKIITSDKGSREIILDSIETNIGRQKSNEVVLNDKSVSRVHAQLINKKYYYKIRDLNSTNGSYVNGELIAEQRLKDGDKIRLGKTVLEFSLDD